MTVSLTVIGGAAKHAKTRKSPKMRAGQVGADQAVGERESSRRFMKLIRCGRAEVSRGKVVSLERVKEDIADEARASKALHRPRRRPARR